MKKRLSASTSRKTNSCSLKCRSLRIERLEDRRLLDIDPLLVTTGSDVLNENDPGYEGTLRWAISLANEHDPTPDHDTIIIMDNTYDFNHIIRLRDELPVITDGVTIRTESGDTVYIDCQDYEGRGLLIEITDAGNDDTVSLTDVGVANASGPAFELGGSRLENATLTDCWVHGSRENVGFRINTSDATSITLTDCTTFRASTGIWLEAGAHVDTLTIEGAEISASGWTPTEPTWYGICCEGTGNVVIQDHIRPDDSIRHASIYDIPGTAIYLNGHGTTDLQAQITGAQIGAVGPIAGNGIVVENWRICRDRNVLFLAA